MVAHEREMVAQEREMVAHQQDFLIQQQTFLYINHGEKVSIFEALEFNLDIRECIHCQC